jgi:hypothetical protein
MDGLGFWIFITICVICYTILKIKTGKGFDD